MASSSDHDGCRRRTGVFPTGATTAACRRLPGYLRGRKAIFPQLLSRRSRIPGIYCRHRWFVRYARSESLLRLSTASHDLQRTSPGSGLPA